MNRKDFGDYRIEWFIVADLHVDWDTYQRGTNERRGHHIADNFDPKLFDPITVSKRPYGNFVVDGAHRLRAARILGLTEIPGIASRYDNVETEAAAFVAKNHGQKDLTAIEDYHGLVACHDPVALHVAECARLAELKIPAHLACIGTVLNIARQYPEILGRCLSIAAVTVIPGDPTRRRVPLWAIAGITHMLVTYPQVEDRRLLTILERDYARIAGQIAARGELGTRTRGITASSVIVDFYNAHLPKSATGRRLGT